MKNKYFHSVNLVIISNVGDEKKSQIYYEVLVSYKVSYSILVSY